MAYLLPEISSKLQAFGNVTLLDQYSDTYAITLKKEISDTEILVSIVGFPIDANILSNAKKLKLIAHHAVGVDNIDLNVCKQLGILVSNTPGVLTESTAELTFALLLSVARRVVEADNYCRSGKFQGWSPTLFLGHELSKKTLGIFGMGRIGLAVAKRAQSFGMEVIFYQRTHFYSEFGQQVDFSTLIQKSDFISIHAPLTSQTHHRFTSLEFEQMKPNCIIINTARGSIIKEEDLFQALLDKKIAGAGLDVFEFEPDIFKPLRDLHQVVLLPHIGSAGYQTRLKMGELVIQNIQSFLANEPIPNLVL